MRKHLLLFLFLMGFLLPPQVFAAEKVVHELTFSSATNSKGVSAYSTPWTAMNGLWDVVNFNNNNNDWSYVKCGSKSVASVAYFATAQSFAEAISSVEVTIDAITATNVNSIYLQVSSSSDFSDADKLDITKAKGTQKVSIPTPASNQYYKITFDCKKSSNGIVTVSKVTLYANEEESGNPDQVAAPTFSISEGWVAEGTEVGLACATEGASIYYTLDGTEPTAESTLYESAIVVSTNTTIKAIAVKDDATSEISSASYKVIPANSAENPLTVSQANTLITDGIDNTIEFYVAGTIETITEVSTQYGNATYIITDGSESMTVYRGSYLNGEKFTSVDQIAVDDKVVVLGKLIDYNGTKEIASGNKLVSIDRPVDERKDPSLTFASDTYSIEKDEMVEVSELGLSAAEGFDLSNVTWTSSNPDILHIEDGTIMALAAGTVSVTATFAGDETWKSSEASISVTVTDANVSVILGKVTITANGVELTDEELANGITVTKGSKIGFACETDGALLTLSEEFGATENYDVIDQTLPYEFVINEEAWFTYLITHPDSEDSIEGELMIAIKEEGGETPTMGTWQLITNDTELEAGMRFVIVNQTAAKAISTETNTNNRRATGVTLSSDKNTVEIGDDVMIFELEGTAGQWALKTTNYQGTNGYIGTTESSTSKNNYCKVLSSAVNASISISATDASATIIFSAATARNTLMYNTSGLFSCYSSGQQPVHIYKYVLVEESAPELPEVTGREMGETHLVITGAPGTTIYYKSEDWVRPSNVIAKAISSDAAPVDLSEYTMNPDTENPHILRLDKSEHPNRLISYLTVSKSGLQSPVGLHGINADGTTTGINDIVTDNSDADTEWYNLQGVRVSNPVNGLYIRRQGTTVEKVMVK